ncbi:MDR family MFS transporter [Tengunoibacter tsumagoiensis]|uniref:MFS transporter n=1 Tax=Tengunoibacter tsumagoiensis TaxID=2014871 RepID=A0A402A708_9CHLR|nr:MDR family MFS transporter [Tengunoibacter tsumagoiensis]GCE14927.1 MFS transporter [Tengunoibacter tsumagoiensis]
MSFSALPEKRQGLIEYKWIVAIVVIFGAFMSVLDQTIVNIAVPRLESSFETGLSSVQWVLTAYVLTQGVVTPTTAFFANRLGTKRFYIISLVLFTIGSALCGLSWNLPALIIFRIVQGIGGAFLFPLGIAQLYRVFPLEERGVATGVFGIATLLAPAVGPTLGGYLITYVNWPAIFYINIPMGIIGVILALLLLKEVRDDVKVRFDLPGFILVAAGLAAVLYALSNASVDGWTSISVLSFLIGGMVLLGLFTIVELIKISRGETPLVNLKLFANGPFFISNLTNVLITFAFFGGLFLFPIYLQSMRGMSAFDSGLLLLPQALAAIITSFIGGRLVDRYGVRLVVIPGLVLLAFVTWQFAYVTPGTSYWWLQCLFIVRGLALGVIIQPLSVSALSDIRPQQLAQASSLYSVIRFISTSLGIAVLATLIQTRMKVAFIPGQPKLSYMYAIQYDFWFCLWVVLGAIVLAFFIHYKRKQVSGQKGRAELPLVEG